MITEMIEILLLFFLIQPEKDVRANSWALGDIMLITWY